VLLKPVDERHDMAYIIGHADGQLDFDKLIEAFCQRYPEARVTDPDYYATRIARQIETSKRLGMAIPSAPLDCTMRVSAEHGAQRDLLLPIRPGLTVRGRLDRHGCLFTTIQPAESETLEDFGPLIGLLNDAQLQVEYGGIDDAAT
jgi:hypothetical protein